jgi:hypothetical protein
LPGWFTDVELGVIGPHVKNRLVDMVQIGTRMPDTVHLPGADLDWTVAPRVEVGYRLPSGFGGVAVAYRFFGSEGTSVEAGPDAAETLKSRLSVNIVDLDYTSREYTYFAAWTMRWRFGMRWADIYFNSQADEPFAAAAAGMGVFEFKTSNNFWGVGPHAGVELARRFEPWGLAVVGSIDGATLLGRVRQNFSEVSTTIGPNGRLMAGNTRETRSQSVPALNNFIGVGWQPPRYPNTRFLVGYQYEYWWNIGRNSTASSNPRGELSDQGILLRAEFNY